MEEMKVDNNTVIEEKRNSCEPANKPKTERKEKDWELIFERNWELMFASRGSHVDSHSSLARWLAGSPFVKTQS